MKLIECVPNFSEGRDRRILDALQDAFVGEGIKLLDFTADRDHNRSVATAVGEPQAVIDSLIRAVGVAVREIDMNLHGGEHPCIGAADVVPLVSIRNVDAQECIAYSHALAAELAARHGLPIYLYQDSATVPHRRNLALIRTGDYAALASRMERAEHRPDYGDAVPHATAGATVVGARPFLIAYNVNLASGNLDAAKHIATCVRERDGGLPCVRALGVMLRENGCAQVSMNLTDYRVTGMVAAFDAVRKLAAACGERVLESEIIGLVPSDAVEGLDSERILLGMPLTEKILETHIPSAWLK